MGRLAIDMAIIPPWVSSLDLESTRKYNLAARWLLRQSGVVRQRGEEFMPEDLAYKPAVVAEDLQSGDSVEIEPEDLLYGLNKLLKALESISGKTDLDKKGELRSAFYLDLKRRPDERIGEFCTRFRTLVADLKSEGINVPSSELGWFLRDKLGLDSIRKQLLETALHGRDGYDDVEGEVLRLLKDLHVADPLSRRFGAGGGGGNDGKPALLHRFLGQASAPSTRSMATSSGASSMSSLPRSFRTSTTSATTSRQSFRSRPPGGHGRQAMVTENDGEQEDEGEAAEEENEAVEVLDEKEAARIRAELQRRDGMHKILTPRYVYTDKNDGLRTKKKQLPILGSARLVQSGIP